MSVIRYQPHIDGLRALAVLLVIFHHLGDWLGLAGGYVGVDVFFVISGFLITSIVRTEVEAGRFTFGGFYKRRVVRLAPAYFTVLLATTVAAFIWMLPAELLAYVRSMAASSLFLANFHMWKEIGGYFGADADTAPLLHLWSLAVEEQFYLFWPVALLLGHRWLGRRWIPWAVVAVAIAGVVVSQWGVVRYPAAAYYLLPTRFFELALGAVLAYLPAARPSRGAAWLSLLGLGLVLYAAVAYGKETLFPGWKALVPVMGTAMLLRWAAGSPMGRVLSQPALVFVGKISYPAYLWHWPIIAFLHINEIAITLPVGVAVLVATFMLSWLTYRWLELPARVFLDKPPRCVVWRGAVAPIAFAVVLAIGVVNANGWPSRFPDSLNRKSEALLAFPNKARGRCNEGPPEAPLPPDKCILGRPTGEVDFLLIGDSHANHFAGFLDELGKDAGMRGYDMTRSNTPYLSGVELDHPTEPEYNRYFKPRNDYINGMLARNQYKVVVLAGAYANFLNRNLIVFKSTRGTEAFVLGMRRALANAVRAADRVVVLLQAPSLAEGLFDCPLRNERFQRDDSCSFPADQHADYAKRESEVFAALAREFPSIVWVDVDQVICDSHRCTAELDGIPLYKDGGHLNDMGARLLARKWIARFGNPLVSAPPADAQPQPASASMTP